MARISGVDLPREKKVEIGLTYIFGIGRHNAAEIMQKAGIAPTLRVRDLTDADVNRIRQVIERDHKVEGALRTEDLLGRYGGDEFVAVLRGTAAEGAREAGERLRKALRVLDLGIPGPGADGPLTISVGLAVYDRSVAQPADLLRRADEALYRAKAAGRNRISD